ncbi:MAG TPA: circularly permuted type 2 ATP-grasp protein [Longimicrobium sp.]
MSADALRRAIDAWHALLDDADLAGESAERLDQEHRSLGMYFGDRALCTVIRPRFFTHAQWAGIRRGVETLMRAFRRAHVAAMHEPALLEQFRLLDWERELIGQDPGFESPCPTSRLDAFFNPDDGSLRFTEYNAETPAGPAYMDTLSEVFLALPVTGEFLRTHVVHPLPARHGVLHALLGAHAQWSGRREPPRIGILDWAEVPTYSEFVFFRDYFRAHGVACEIADPRNLEYRDGKLMAGDFHVTLIYKRVLIDELVLRMGIDNPVVRAVRDGAVCMVNPFRCKVLYKKASLAVLGDERNDRLFTPDEQAAIEAHVPWTRIVEERRTRFHGTEIDLLPWAESNRERLVLKPNDDYGGRGIVLGWLVSDDAWRAALKTALETPYVLQERIILPTEPFPSWVDGKVEIYDRMVDVAPFVTRTATIDGALTRIATDPLLNVTAGGGSSVATMLVERR